MRKSVVIMKKTELRDQLYGQISYLDLLVGEKREHEGLQVLSGIVGEIRYSQRRGRKLWERTVPIS